MQAVDPEPTGMSICNSQNDACDLLMHGINLMTRNMGEMVAAVGGADRVTRVITQCQALSETKER